MAAAKKKAGGAATGDGRATWSRRNYAPVVMLSVEENGRFIEADDLLSQLTQFRYKESLGKASETKFTFRNDDRAMAEDPRFLANSVWKFRFGYFNDLSPIHVAYLRNLEPEYSQKMSITVTLYDASLNLSQTSKAKNWGKVASSEIVKKIAKSHGLLTSIDPSNDVPKKAWIQPVDLNDIQFVRDMAAMIDFEVAVKDDPPMLYYRKKNYESAPKAVFTYYDDPSEHSYLKSFKPKVTNLGPYVSGVSGTDSINGKGDKADSTDPSKRFPGLAVQLNHAPIKKGAAVASTQVIQKPVASPAPANVDSKKLAEAKRSQLLDKANEAHSEHPLMGRISKGEIYTINGVEKPLQGKWYIQEVSSEISGTKADTTISWKRNATGGKKDVANVNNKDAEGGKNAGPHIVTNFSASGNYSGVNGIGSVVYVPRNSPLPPQKPSPTSK